MSKIRTAKSPNTSATGSSASIRFGRMVATWPMIGTSALKIEPSFGPRSTITGISASVKLSKAGRSASPTPSFIALKASPIFTDAVAVASAVPPTWVSSAFRIMSCASRSLPEVVSSLILAFSVSVNVTPDFASAVIPLIGSFSALPSCTALPSAVPNPVAAKSSAALVARSNAPLCSSALRASSLNVRSLAWVALITSASTPSWNSWLSAKSFRRLVTAPVSAPKTPIDLATCASRSLAFCAASAPRIAPFVKFVIAATENAPAISPPSLPSDLPSPPSSPWICFIPLSSNLETTFRLIAIIEMSPAS